VAVFCEHGDEHSGCGATELVGWLVGWLVNSTGRYRLRMFSNSRGECVEKTR
jgi:hypothetical protein